MNRDSPSCGPVRLLATYTVNTQGWCPWGHEEKNGEGQAINKGSRAGMMLQRSCKSNKLIPTFPPLLLAHSST